MPSALYTNAIVIGLEYTTMTSGSTSTCLRITSLSECSVAAAAVGLSDTSAVDDDQNAVSYDPPYCYFEGGSLKFNNGTNTGPCKSSDTCVCIAKLAAPVKLVNVRVGTNLAGTAALPNKLVGIHCDFRHESSLGVVIGEAGAGSEVVASGNTQEGIKINCPSASVVNVRAGTDLAGTTAVPNGPGAVRDGIRIKSSGKNTTIGAAGGGGEVVVSGNTGNGIWVEAQDVKLRNVRAGVDISGTAALPNERDGIVIAGDGVGAAIGAPGAGGCWQ